MLACCWVLPGAVGCCRVLPQAVRTCGYFQVLPNAAGCCRAAGLPGCRVAGSKPGQAKVNLAAGLLPGLCSGYQVGDSVDTVSLADCKGVPPLLRVQR